MPVCRSLVLLGVLWVTPCWSAPDRGQSPSTTTATATERALLPIDASMFEIAVATGGFYSFWAPGEFARVAGQDSMVLLMGTGQTVEQIDGQLEGVLDLPFEVAANHAEIVVRVGLQSRGEIELWAPDATTPYAGEPSLRTTHMLIVRAPTPVPGTWTVRLAGSGVYLVNVTAHGGEGESERAEREEPCAWADDPSGEPTPDDFACFRSASSEERWDLFRRLPAPRRETLARALLDDADPLVAYIAAGSLARDGHLDEAVPVFARILVRGEAETALHGRMGYDWIHDDDATLADRILDALRQHLRSHLDDYSPSERKRAEALLRG